MRTSRRFDTLPTSETIAISGRAAELRRLGHDVVSFAAGEPDFPTPPHVVEAMVAAARAGATRYPPLLGIPELRSAVARQSTRRYEVDVDSQDVIVTPGAKLALWAAIQVLVDPGDEVLVPTPCWVSYAPQITLAGGRMVAIPTLPERGFRIDAESVRRAITPRTVGLVLNLPNNPTGAMASQDELGAIADIAIERDLWILSDDIYADLRFESGPYASPLRARPDLRDRMVVVDGPSKSWAMTGWRIGYAIVPRALVPRFAVLLAQTVTGVTTFAQHGATAALEGDNSVLEQSVAVYRARLELVLDRIERMGLTAVRPEGAFYTLVDVRPLLGSHEARDDVELAKRLLEEHHVATVPGSAFLAPGFLRVSFACAEGRLRVGLDRLASFADEMRSARTAR